MDTSHITPDTLRASGLKKWSAFPDCVGMWVAETDFGVADCVQEAILAATARTAYGYIPSTDVQACTSACASWYQNRYGTSVDPGAIRLVGDVLTGLRVAVTHFVPEGAPIVIPTPAYMPFLPLSAALGHPVIQVPLLEDGWLLDLDAIGDALTPGALFILCNPHNPTGRVYRRDELEALSHVIEQAGARVFADEIHAPLVYPGHRHIPYFSVSEATARHTITATSASKAWNMPGLKCAQVIFSNPDDARRYDATGAWESDTTGILGVFSNTAAYQHGREWLGELVTLLDENMAMLESTIPEVLPRARFTRPAGTFLAWLDVRAYDLPTPVDRWLRETAHVAIIDGRRCGDAGRGFIRLCMGTTPEIAREGITRIATAITAIRP